MCNWLIFLYIWNLTENMNPNTKKSKYSDHQFTLQYRDASRNFKKFGENPLYWTIFFAPIIHMSFLYWVQLNVANCELHFLTLVVIWK